MEEDNGPDTGEKELAHLLYILKKNGYEFKHVNEAENYYGYYDATFEKSIKYTDTDGDYINDNHISVNIQFANKFDYKNLEKDEKGDDIYDETKGFNFIKNIYDKLLITDEHVSVENIVNTNYLSSEIEK